jgi:PKD repeat protein
MSSKLYLSLAAAILLLATPLHAQKECNIWYFGRGLGIDFSTGVPTGTNSPMIQLEGTASIADRATGALLFYTNGITVWTRTGTVMTRGTGLLGHNSATQSALIVPMPGDSMKYYIFTADQEGNVAPNRGVHYSVVDMNLAGGSGAITVKNMEVLAQASEKLTAIPHCNGRDYWILVHSLGGQTFHAFALTTAGVSATPVSSAVGRWQGTIPPYTMGYLKASPDGRKLASACREIRFVEIFDFDPATGVVSNPIDVSPSAAVPGLAYGVAFSPDNSKVYFGWGASLYQCSLQPSDPASILASRVVVNPTATWDPDKTFYAMQLGPDRKIYVIASDIYSTALNKASIDVLDLPNNPRTACGYRSRAVALNGANIQIGLPNCIDAHPVCAGPTASFSIAASTICVRECITPVDASTGSPTEWQWRFPGGNPSSFSGRTPPNVCYQQTGRYPITLVVRNGSGVDSMTIFVTVIDCEEGDFIVHLPDLCVGSTERVRIPFFNRYYSDTALTVSFEAGSLDATLDTALPLPLTPSLTVYIPILYRWTRPGVQKSVMRLVGSSGTVYRISLVARVGGRIDSLLSRSILNLGKHSGTFDTCVTLVNRSYTSLRFVDTAWVGPGREVRIISPPLPFVLERNAPVTLCLRLTSNGGDYSDTLLLSAEAVDSCRIPFCASHQLVIDSRPPRPVIGPLSVETEDVLSSDNTLILYPNPAATFATIEFRLGHRQSVRILLLDLSGREIATLSEGMTEAGEHRIALDLSGVPSGSYLIRLDADATRRVLSLQVVR